MNEGDLGFFVLLARHESFVETAREIGVTASAVSRRLARLEVSLLVLPIGALDLLEIEE